MSEEHRLLPRFRQAQLNARAAQTLKPMLIERGDPLPRRKPISSEPGDAHKLRGIPAVGVRGGLGGAIAGTKPGASEKNLDHWIAGRRRAHIEESRSSYEQLDPIDPTGG